MDAQHRAHARCAFDVLQTSAQSGRLLFGAAASTATNSRCGRCGARGLLRPCPSQRRVSRDAGPRRGRGRTPHGHTGNRRWGKRRLLLLAQLGSRVPLFRRRMRRSGISSFRHSASASRAVAPFVGAAARPLPLLPHRAMPVDDASR